MQASYSETVPLPPWVALCLVAALAGCGFLFANLQEPVAEEEPGRVWLWDVGWAVGLLCIVGVPLFFGRMRILVESGALVVRFGFVPGIEKQIPLHLIAGAEAIRYRPILQFGGWGIRRGRFEGAKTAVYSLRGTQGVLLRLHQPIPAAFVRTDCILIGSGHPQRLADHLNAVVGS